MAHGIRRELQMRCTSSHETQGRHQQAEIDTLQTTDAFSPPTRKRVFMLSGFDERSCLDQSQRLRKYLLNKQQTSEQDFLHDLSFTLNERRSRFMWKNAVVGDSVTSLVDALSSSTKPRSCNRTPTLGFVFTGQGAQWVGMGKELLDAYPVFNDSIAKIDAYLRHIGAPFTARGMFCPNFSNVLNNNVNYLEELMKQAEDSELNHPLLSQTICTALQIALVDLLNAWKIFPDSVIGHSSGEIAAAYAAGALRMEDAMAVAYYRGVSAVQVSVEHKARGAMMAIGMDPANVQPYLDGLTSGKVVVACVNSPSSVTVSGEVAGIDELEQKLHDKPVFCRRLAVDVAYHSHHMELVAKDYLELISGISPRTQASIPGRGAQPRQPAFFSSVTGKEAHIESLGPEYWVSNLLGQVSFAESVKALCFETNVKRKGAGTLTNKRTRRAGAAQKVNVDCLLEIGPHSALSGPVKQILQADPKLNAGQITYASILIRKSHAVTTALKATALLASLSYPIDFDAVNCSVGNSNTRKPRLLIDLPPYAWSHTRSYWAEPRLSRMFRNRMHARTDLLGVRDNMACPFEPRWRNYLRLSELPWLADHKIQSNIVYPAAGYIAMAIEASIQLAKNGDFVGVVIRDISMEFALVVSETAPVEIMLSLREIEQTTSDEFDQLHNFYIYSVTQDNKWALHCTGVVGVQSSDNADVMLLTSEEMIEQEIDGFVSIPSETEIHGISVVDTNELYDQLRTVGLEYGACFANLTEAHATDDGACFGEITVPEIGNLMPVAFPSAFMIHPCTLDSIFHTIFAALPAYMGLEQGPAIPVRIEEMRLSSGITCLPGDTLSVCTHVLPGLQGDVIASIAVMDQNARNQCSDGSILMRGVQCKRLEQVTSERYTETSDNIAYNIEWKPDPEFLFYRERSKILHQVQKSGNIDMPPFELETCAANFLRAAIDDAEGAEMKEIDDIDQKYLSHLKETLRMYDENYREASYPRFVDLEGIRTSGPLGEMLCMLGDQLASGIHQHVPTLRSIQIPQLWDIFCEIPSYQQTFAMATEYLSLITYKAPEITILEVGAGMGQTTKLFLRGILDKGGIPRCSEYTYTHPDKSVVEKATEQLESWSGWVSCKQLDVEHDLAEQGFLNSRYDIIIVPHGLRGISSTRQALSTIKQLLTPSGYLIYIDLLHKPHNAVEGLIFNALYKFKQGDVLEVISGESNQAQWSQKFDEASLSTAKPDDDVNVSGAGTLTICKHKRNTLKKDKGVLIICEHGHPEIDFGFLQKQLMMLSIDMSMTDIAHAQPKDRICIVLSNLHIPILSQCDEQMFKQLKNIFLYSEGVLWVTRGGAMESTNPEAALATGFARTARSETGVSSIITLDLDGRNSLSGARTAELIYDVINCRFLQPNNLDNDMEYAERGGNLYIPRIVENAEVNQTIHTIYEAETVIEQPFQQRELPLRAPRRIAGTLSAPYFLPDQTTTEIPVGYVGVEVQSFGLSERDIQEHYQTTEAESTLGLECSGNVYALGAGVHGFSVGDRVACFGVGTARSLYHDRASAFQKMDDEMPFELAAALPMAYCTAYYVLHCLSQVECNDAVLILDAFSWVGQAIVDMCCMRGAQVFATVTTAEQSALLTSRFAIPPTQIFSATEHFTSNIMSLNGGKKANIAINCGHGNDQTFRLALNCVASFGQFIQIRSQTSTTNHRLEVPSCPKNISYSTFNLFELRRDRSDLADQIWSKVFQLFRAGRLHGPSSIATYNVANIAEALRSIPLERHVVVVSGPEDTVKVKSPIDTTKKDL